MYGGSPLATMNGGVQLPYDSKTSKRGDKKFRTAKCCRLPLQQVLLTSEKVLIFEGSFCTGIRESLKLCGRHDRCDYQRYSNVVIKSVLNLCDIGEVDDLTKDARCSHIRLQSASAHFP